MRYLLLLMICVGAMSSLIESRSIESTAQAVKNNLDDDTVTTESQVKKILSDAQSACRGFGLSSNELFKTVKSDVQKKLEHYQSRLQASYDDDALNDTLGWFAASLGCIGLAYFLYINRYERSLQEYNRLTNVLRSVGASRAPDPSSGILVPFAQSNPYLQNEVIPRYLKLEDHLNFFRKMIFALGVISSVPLMKSWIAFRRFLTPDFEEKFKKYAMITQQLEKYIAPYLLELVKK
jgi:hypothetical protein